MKNESLVILAGGASSRMKKSLSATSLDGETLQIAKKLHKSLIPVGKDKRPLLYYLLKNALAAQIKRVYIITSVENGAFKEFAKKIDGVVNIDFAVQYIPENREKPLGTADALQQCLEQYPDLLKERFTVCNGDNLYSTGAFMDLKKDREAPNALISYSSEGLKFSRERIAKFALMHIDAGGFLQDIVEKPKEDELDAYRDANGILRVSMNIFNFSGEVIYPYLKNCKLDPIRNEKELPKAVCNLVHESSKSVLCYPRTEHIPDLTDANDIEKFITPD
ncbi:sugar phosphate nucleotidyltransferase [Croceitalea sp. MTPC9]|uniref:sugar phosphate nucleotidyltransferase n=1 Tax=unclassified Croceitalea TaxID=2632280 RepID=UPI002B3992F6|nr:sugar phosphate nucleotidyltransferase [Croceitalea sp. MTPC6]GMN18275.1 sugar phosphate nucleotidyltransferase [Croceitalea sp. MTPC9]